MINSRSKDIVFSKYKTSVLLVFLLIAFTVIYFSGYRYYAELASHKSSAKRSLAQQSALLDEKLDKSINTVLSIQQFANYYLSYPEELSATLPPLVQEGERFYLKMTDEHEQSRFGNVQHVGSNITGITNLSELGEDLAHEITMANALTPAFVTGKNTAKEATWFYYVSFSRFISLYPWIDRKSWQYTDSAINSNHFDKIKATLPSNREPIWSTPYLDSAGSGLSSSVGIGVFRERDILGVAVVDITLANLHDSLPEVLEEGFGYILVDQQLNVMVHKTSENKALTAEKTLGQVIPKSLSSLNYEQFVAFEGGAQQEDWWIQTQPLTSNGWLLIKYQDYKGFVAPVFHRFIYVFTVLFVGLLGLLSIIYWLSHRTFIQPTTEFISHIEYCAQGDLGKIKAPQNWQHWFSIVEDIFGQNRSLMVQLKDQNTLLDNRVNEKTKALQLTLIEHQRDYALLRSVMDAIPEYIIFTSLKGSLVDCNQTFEHFLAQDGQSHTIATKNRFPNNELGQILTPLLAELSDDTALQKIVRTQENTYQVYCKYIYNDDTKLGVIYLVRDVTEQYQIQADLTQAKEQAENANKAKSQFLANMSHEIRTPINAIQGMITLLAKSALNPYQTQYVDYAKDASKSLLYLVEDLLDLSKIESGKMPIVKKDFSLDDIVESALLLNIDMIRRKELSIAVHCDFSVPKMIYSDDMKLVQVLTNLVNNATKFTHDGGIDIYISVDSSDTKEELLRVAVKDSGIGIAEEIQPHLFEAFKQADDSMTRNYGGSGLGLSICQQIMHMLGGEISLTSELGKGSEFLFTLPLVKATEDKSAFTENRDVSISNLHINLPAETVALIEKNNWQYQELTKLGDLSRLPEQSHVVVLLDTTSAATEDWQALQTSIDLVVLHHTKSRRDNAQAQEILARANVPYIVVQPPLYRKILLDIDQALTNEYGNLSDDFGRSALSSEDLSNVRVLLVEDNPVNQLVAKELLKSMGATVLIADNGQIALDLLQENSVDVVLMDIQMPVMDGLTATLKIREQAKFADLPIIAMTAHARDEDRDKCLSVGMNRHMAKPIQAELLMDNILVELNRH